MEYSEEYNNNAILVQVHNFNATCNMHVYIYIHKMYIVCKTTPSTHNKVIKN